MLTTTDLSITTILFDMDGTLFDTAADLAFALNQLLQRHQRKPLSYDTIRPFASDGSPGLLKLGFDIETSDSHYVQLRQEFLNIYAQQVVINTTLFSGMNEVLIDIEKKSLRWGVVTNKPSAYAQQIMDHFQLTKRCACLIGGDRVARTKPAPDSLLLACQTLAVTPETCVYIGDAERDIIAAKAAGMHSLAALYGYIKTSENPSHWHADGYVQTPLEIINWLNTTTKLAK